MKEIRCAVLGLGRLGYWHAENLAFNVPGAKLVKVIDPIEGRAEEVAKKLMVSGYSQDPNDAFLDKTIDAIVIVTPTSMHAEMIKCASENGKHIYVEKPLTDNLEDAKDVIRVLEENNTICQVGFMRRFDSAYVAAKKKIDAGIIGKPLYFKGITRDGNVPHENFIKNSGGIFLDVSIHDYDIARFLMGDDDVNSIHATGNILMESNKFMEKYNDVDQGISTIRFKSGAAADIETMRIGDYGYDIRGEVIGTAGAIKIGSMRESDIEVFTTNQQSRDLVQDFPTRFKQAYLDEITHFVYCLQTGLEPRCTALDGKKALEISIAATKSYEKEKEIIIN